MYKKITHNIVEEHFDHPMAAKIKAGLRPRQLQRTRLDIDDEDIIFGRPTNEIFKKSEFSTNLETYLNNYTQRLIQISDSVGGTEEQLVTAFEELFDMVDSVSSFFNPFYNRELGERFVTSFRHIALTLTMITHSVKAGFDTQPWTRTLIVPIASINNYNERWQQTAIQTHLSDFIGAIIKRINAVKAGDSAVMEQTARDAYTAMGTLKTNIFNGITQQFPYRFVD